MTFILHVQLGNDAMQTGDDVSDLLEKVAKQIWTLDVTKPDSCKLRDANGNTVGFWEVAE